MALLVTLELPPGHDAPNRRTTRSGARAKADAPDTPLVRFCRALDEAGVLDDVEIAVPGDHARAAQLLAVREAVPDGGESSASAARSRRSTNASKRPRPT